MKPRPPVLLVLLLAGLPSIPLAAQTAAEYETSAQARSRQRDHAGAVADWTKAIDLEPTAAARYLGRSAARRALGDFAGAIADLDRVVALQPDNAGAFCTRGRTKVNLGDLDGALADESRALALQPDLMMAYYTRGAVRQAGGDDAGAVADYDRAIPLARDTDQHGFFSRYLRSFCLRRLHRDAGLADLAEKLAAWNGGWNRTIGLYLVGALPEKEFLAQADEGDARTVRDRHHDAYFYIGMNRLLGGDPAGARDFLAKCVALNVTHYIEFPLARAELARLDQPR